MVSEMTTFMNSIQLNSNTNPNDFIFEAELCEAQRLIPMLRTIHISKFSMMAITSRGMKITCQLNDKCLQANSFIDRSLFVSYRMTDEEIPITLTFRLLDLLNVLHIFLTQPFIQTNGVLKICYKSNSDNLILYVNDDTVQSKAYIKTFNGEELMLFNMTFVNKVILSSESLIDFWKSVDIESDGVRISVYKTEPWLQLTTDSERSKSNYNIERDSEEVELFDCGHNVSNKYKMSLLKLTLKALSSCSKLSIRTDTEGLLSLQFMIKLDSHHNEHCFVEYFILPDVEIPV